MQWMIFILFTHHFHSCSIVSWCTCSSKGNTLEQASYFRLNDPMVYMIVMIWTWHLCSIKSAHCTQSRSPCLPIRTFNHISCTQTLLKQIFMMKITDRYLLVRLIAKHCHYGLKRPQPERAGRGKITENAIWANLSDSLSQMAEQKTFVRPNTTTPKKDKRIKPLREWVNHLGNVTHKYLGYRSQAFTLNPMGPIPTAHPSLRSSLHLPLPYEFWEFPTANLPPDPLPMPKLLGTGETPTSGRGMLGIQGSASRWIPSLWAAFPSGSSSSSKRLQSHPLALRPTWGRVGSSIREWG